MNVRKQSNSNIKLTASQKEKIQNLELSFNQADSLVKEVEDFIGEAGIPALNEMRNAGYHLAHSILLDDCKFCDNQITSATNHCKRACYEASEAGIVVSLLKFREFRNDYKTLVVSEILKEWPQIQKDFEQSQKDINRVKGTADRSADYEARMDVFRKVKNHCETMNVARDDLNAKIQEGINSTRKFILGSLITICGIIIASVFAYLQLNKDNPNEATNNQPQVVCFPV